MDVLTKVPVREQEAAARAKNFDEVCLGYNKEEAMEEAVRCSASKGVLWRSTFLRLSSR